MIFCGIALWCFDKPRWCRKVMVGQPFRGRVRGTQVIVRHDRGHRGLLLTLLALAPLVAGCQSASDLMSKDAEWFSRSGRLFIRNVSIDAPPLTPDTPIRPDDLVSADGACPGMVPPGGDAQALADNAAGAPPVPGGTVALGHTECDVVRGIGAPDSVNLSTAPGGGRLAVVTWSRGTVRGPRQLPLVLG